jgi:hypothetical protein
MWICLALLPTAAGHVEGADRIVLRNLDVVSGKTVVRFDEDGVQMDDGSLIAWDGIERGQVAASGQAAFDRMLQELGTPLYRIRQRLTVGDYAGLLDHAETLYPRYVNRKSQTAYMVLQSLMWARLSVGRREESVEPYLRCYACLRSAAGKQVVLPGTRRLQLDVETGMSPELAPIWFDAESAKKVLPAVLQAISSMPAPRPEGTRVYYGTLALAAGEVERGISVLRGIEGQLPLLAELRDIAGAQLEVANGQPGPAVSSLANRLNAMSAANKPLAIYWLGIAKLLSDQEPVQREGVLQLLHLPAVYGKQSPELAAAALYRTMGTFHTWKDDSAQSAIRRELLGQYGQTYYGAKVLAELSPNSPPGTIE